MHFWSIFKAATRYHRCTYVQVSILQKIWLVITYYRTSQDIPSAVLRWGKIPSLAAVGKCNTETNYGWNWKVTGLFCLNNRLAEGLSAEVERLPKCSYSMISFDTWTCARWTTSPLLLFFSLFRFPLFFTFNLTVTVFLFLKAYRKSARNKMVDDCSWVITNHA